jgi:hypothetical protein
MGKIYCGECKWLTEKNFGFGMASLYICSSPKNIKNVSDWKNKYSMRERPEILNAKNNCKLYEAK